MIKKLKIKLICLAMIALFIVLAVSVAGMNAVNYSTIVQEADSILEFLSRNEGVFPVIKGSAMEGRDFPEHFSPETPYESRFFSVLVDRSGGILRAETSKIFSVDREQAGEYAQKAFYSDNRSGFADEYRYLRSEEETSPALFSLTVAENWTDFINISGSASV